MTIHRLKIWPQFFDDVKQGKKTFELRRNDRDFKVGDVLRLEEFRPAVGEYTGRACEVTVNYVMACDNDTARIGLPSGYCILGISIEGA